MQKTGGHGQYQHGFPAHYAYPIQEVQLHVGYIYMWLHGIESSVAQPLTSSQVISE